MLQKFKDSRNHAGNPTDDQKTRDEMEALPPPPSSDPVLELMHLVNEFCDAAYYQSEGIYLKDSDSKSVVSSDNQFEGIRMQQKILGHLFRRQLLGLSHMLMART